MPKADSCSLTNCWRLAPEGSVSWNSCSAALAKAVTSWLIRPWVVLSVLATNQALAFGTR